MSRPLHASRGQSMVEFMIVTPVMLLLVFGALQFAFLYHAKTALNYATFQTAREGAVNHAYMAIMENAFARNMAAIYTNDDTVAAVVAARDRIRQEITAGFVRIDIVNPTELMFEVAAFGVNTPDGDRVIPNDNLMYRPLTREPMSNATVQDANLLKLRITYCYPMYVPYVNRVLAIMLTHAPDPDTCVGCSGTFVNDGFEKNCLDNGRFPLNAQAIVRMQSAASLAGRSTSRPLDTSVDIANTAFDPAGVGGTAGAGNQTELTGFWQLEISKPAGGTP